MQTSESAFIDTAPTCSTGNAKRTVAFGVTDVLVLPAAQATFVDRPKIMHTVTQSGHTRSSCVLVKWNRNANLIDLNREGHDSSRCGSNHDLAAGDRGRRLPTSDHKAAGHGNRREVRPLKADQALRYYVDLETSSDRSTCPRQQSVERSVTCKAQPFDHLARLSRIKNRALRSSKAREALGAYLR